MHSGRLEIRRGDKPVHVVAVPPEGGVIIDGGLDGISALFVAPSVEPAPPAPPRELEAMTTAEVAAYLAERIASEEQDRRWDGMGEDL
jgi:hypothetical protein